VFVSAFCVAMGSASNYVPLIRVGFRLLRLLCGLNLCSILGLLADASCSRLRRTVASLGDFPAGLPVTRGHVAPALKVLGQPPGRSSPSLIVLSCDKGQYRPSMNTPRWVELNTPQQGVPYSTMEQTLLVAA